MWLKSLHVHSTWWAGSRPMGGMLHRVNNPIANLPPGVWDNGGDLAQDLARRVGETALSPMPCDAERIRLIEGGFEIVHGDDSTPAGAVIMATGTRYKKLGIPGENEGLGRWVSQSAARDADKFGGNTVLVVGGGDAAFENALRLEAAGAKVLLAARSSSFRARLSYVDEVRASDAISILPVPTEVQELEATAAGCRAICLSGGKKVVHEVACVFVRIGVEPVVPHVEAELSVDDRGFVIVDRLGHTSVDGLFAAGDVTCTNLRSVATSLGDGAHCARSAAEFIGTFFDS
jgi:thioredoxin reductase (NADPH)